MEKKRGDANEITRAYFDSLLLEARYIDSDTPSTQIDLFGDHFDTPIMTAALSHMHRIYENGMVELATGAKNSGAVYWTGMGDEAELEAITATGARTIKIIKPYVDNEVIFNKITHAKSISVLAVGMDIDHSFGNDGTYDNVLGFDMRPKNFEELKMFVDAARPLPFIVKGVLSVSDAMKCLAAGAAGIVVSHHHGRLAYAVPPLQILPEIVKAIDGHMKIFVDCCIESGVDAYKALALGADAVCVGQALIPDLKEGGHQGVTDKINKLTDELKYAMAYTGVKSMDAFDSSVIWHREG